MLNSPHSPPPFPHFAISIPWHMRWCYIFYCETNFTSYFILSSPQKCILERPCENMECEGMTRVLDQSGLQTIKCGINFMFYKETYLLSVSAMNPLHYAQFSLNTTLDFSIRKSSDVICVLTRPMSHCLIICIHLSGDT